jgi:RHS repeat-associated protein
MTVAGQPTVNYTYDNANRLTQITQGTSTVSVTYDAANRRSTLTLPNGVLVTYGYDGASRLNSLIYTIGMNLVGNLTYGYDASGKRTQMGGSLARTGLPQPIASASYNVANRITQWSGANFTYDGNGNMTGDGLNTYTWDARNQLASIAGPSVVANFQYDAFGRRSGKTINTAATGFLYDSANVVQELSGGSPSANLLTGLGIDETFRRTDSTGAGNFIADGLNSTLGLLDVNGAVLTQFTYEPFGKMTSSGAGSANSSQYTGRENDGTGLYYYRARYYHPGLQRFISEDPLGFGGGDSNLYSYAGNSPTNFSDPRGEEALPALPVAGPVVLGGGGVVGTAVGAAVTAYGLLKFGAAFDTTLTNGANNLIDFYYPPVPRPKPVSGPLAGGGPNPNPLGPTRLHCDLVGSYYSPDYDETICLYECRVDGAPLFERSSVHKGRHECAETRIFVWE